MKPAYMIGAGILSLLGLAALALVRPANTDVSLHGVNYSDREFSYFIADPEDPEEFTGGEHIGPFAGGGTTCCATLPRKWTPGTKLRLTTRHWLKKRPDGRLPEITEKHEVEVPEYAEAGELWVIRNADGKISVVSSNVQPDHPDWPGTIKGWPVPSLEYQRERWELYRKLAQGDVDLFISLLAQLEQDPENHAKKMWEHDKEYSASVIAGFTHSADPRYLAHLKKDYLDGLRRNRLKLDEIMKAKP